MIKKIGMFFLSILVIIAMIVLFRALFVPPPREASVKTPITTLANRYPQAATHLSQALRIPTISAPDFYHTENFTAFNRFLDQTYPLINRHLIKKSFGSHALLYEWRGKNPGAPAILLMAHYDVVPAEKPDAWGYPPFSGKISEGYIWGRGAIDDKFNLIGLLEAVTVLLNDGYQPERTIYFAFGADEEIGGMDGNAKIATYFSEKNIKIAYVIDEGLPITKGMLIGMHNPVAAVGIAEKGYLSIKLSSEATGGHASIPNRDNPITRLSEVIVTCISHPLPPQWNAMINTMFQSALPNMSFLHRLIFANLWLTRPFIEHAFTKNPITNALISTTIAPTIIRGGVKDNVIPTSAEAIINFRLIPGDTIDDVLFHLHTLADPKAVTIEPVGKSNHIPIPTADIHSIGFQTLTEAIQSSFSNAIVVPSIMVATTDSRYYIPFTHNIFRFYPWIAAQSDIATIHGRNERISVNAFLTAIYFYEKLITLI